MPSQSIYHQKWYAEEYDQDRFGTKFGRYLHNKELETFLSLIDGRKGRLLDIGAGTGKLSLPLLRQSQPVISIDSSSEMLKVARKKAENEGMVLESLVSDAHQLCFQDNSFEVVISSRVLMHLADWKRGISELCRIGQCVVIDFPPMFGFSGFDSLFKKCQSFFWRDASSYNVFSVRSVLRELRRHDFEITSVKRSFFLPIAFHRWLDRPQLSVRVERVGRVLGLTSFLGAPVTVKGIKRESKS